MEAIGIRLGRRTRQSLGRSFCRCLGGWLRCRRGWTFSACQTAQNPLKVNHLDGSETVRNLVKQPM